MTDTERNLTEAEGEEFRACMVELVDAVLQPSSRGVPEGFTPPPSMFDVSDDCVLVAELSDEVS